MGGMTLKSWSLVSLMAGVPTELMRMTYWSETA